MSGNDGGTALCDLLALWRRLPPRAQATLPAGASALAEGRVADFDGIHREARATGSDSDDERPSDD